ncbi:MAG TPA: diguanylate cyclase [Acidimicrobiia bacterium]|nr:diguanylate cyclase [Acidimicrobiia bacterium]
MTHPDPPPIAAGRRAAYALVAVASVAALATAVLGRAAAVIAWIVVGGLCLAAIAWGLRNHHPVPARAWLLTAVGVLFWIAAGVTRIWFAGNSTDAVATDLLALAAFIPLMLGQIELGRHRGDEHHRDGLIDGCIFMLVALLVVWVTLVVPVVDGSPSPDQLAVAAFPLLDVLLIASIIWISLLPGARSAALAFFIGAFAVVFVVDGARYLGYDLSGGYLIALALLSGGFLHPSCRHAAQRPDHGEADRLHRGRLVLLGMAMFAGPVATMFVENDFAVGNLFITVCGLTLVALVVVRFVDVVRDSEHSRRRFRVMAESLPVGICEIDADLRVGYANPEADRLTGAALEQLRIADVLDQVEPIDRDTVQAALSAVRAGTPKKVVVQLRAEPGDVRWIQLRATPMPGAHERGVAVLASMLDITQLKTAQARLKRQATHDPLTGLPNRRLLTDEALGAIERAARHPVPIGMLFCDLDGFKEVNDELGHEAGDHLLVEIGRRLAETVRTIDTVARMGGDEFVVLCEDAGTRDDLERLARRIVAATNRPIEIDGRSVVVGVSVGVALAGEHTRAAGLLREADSAMYRAKALGRNRVEFADSTHRDLAPRDLAPQS